MLIQVVREWKGDVMMEFDEREVRVYEGGFVGDMNRGYKREGEGTEYRKDGKRVLYIGGWKNGLREGMGKEYDENGEVLIDAEWINGRVTTDPLKVSVIHQVLHLMEKPSSVYPVLRDLLDLHGRSMNSLRRRIYLELKWFVEAMGILALSYLLLGVK